MHKIHAWKSQVNFIFFEIPFSWYHNILTMQVAQEFRDLMLVSEQFISFREYVMLKKMKLFFCVPLVEINFRIQ